MGTSRGFLSDQWHLVAKLRVGLRPDCPVRRQVFRGQTWFVISDPYSNRHFRVRTEAWVFLGQLNRKKTVDEIWSELVKEHPDKAPGQREVVHLLTEMHGANLLVAESVPEAMSMVKRREKEEQHMARQQMLNFLFLRIPLFDPDPILEKVRIWGRALLSPLGICLWFFVVGMGAKAVVDNWGMFRAGSSGLLAPGNLGWLYLVWGFVKIFHELGHGMMTKRFGGEVRSCGIMLLVFTPVPFVDTSAAWAFRKRYERVMVGTAGMIFEILLASIFAIIWAKVEGEGVVGQVAYNIILLASVSTLMFNGNPLLRFDGYYILSDLIGAPNLHQKSAKQWRRWFERLMVGVDGTAPVGQSKAGALGLGMFGAASAIYRVFVLVVIISFIAGQAFELGILLAAFGIIVWLGGPIVKFYRYLATDPGLARRKGIAWAWGLGLPAGVILFLALVPMPQAVRAPGIVEGAEAMEIFARGAGEIREVRVESGAWVEAGQLLVTMENPGLEEKREELEGLKAELEARRTLAWKRLPAVLKPINERLKSTEAQLEEIEEQLKSLSVRAPMSGIWSSPFLEMRRGSHLPRGTLLGRLRRRDSFVFEAVVNQRDIDRLTHYETDAVEVRMKGTAAERIPARIEILRMAESRRLPSVSLGWHGGGSVKVDPSDGDGQLAEEAFFRLRVGLSEKSLPMLYQRTGVVRVALEPRPWGIQMWNRLKQYIQERYGR